MTPATEKALRKAGGNAALIRTLRSLGPKAASPKSPGWSDAAYYANSQREHALAPPGGQFRVARGGFWSNVPLYLRLSNRGRNIPGNRFNVIGCRWAAELP